MKAIKAVEIFTDESGQFWGNAGAGGIFYAEDTGRVLVQKRSPAVNEPNTWGVWGGAIDPGEKPDRALKREVEEESGYRGKYELERVWTFKKGNFQYHNYLITVPEEFEPRHGWESTDHAWVDIDDVPNPIHFGLKAALPYFKRAVGQRNKKAVARSLRAAAGALKAKSYSPADVPKHFYMVTSLPETSDRWEQLAQGKLDGVVGVSGSSLITENFHGDTILKIPGKALIVANKVSRIMYDKPEYLVSKGLDAVYRIANADTDSMSGHSAVADRLFGTMLGKGGSASVAALHKDLSSNFKEFGFLRELSFKGDAIRQVEKQLAQGRKKVKSIKDLAKLLKRGVESIDPYDLRDVQRRGEANDKLYYRMAERALRDFGKIFHREAEWRLKGGMLNLPKGTVIYRYEGDDSNYLLKELGIDKRYRVVMLDWAKFQRAMTSRAERRDQQKKKEMQAAAEVLARDVGRVIPKKFYVVVPLYSDHDRNVKRVKDVARGVLDGVQGISDKAEIIMQWYGAARNAVIAMDAKKLMQMNKLSRVQYDNPHYLASDGLFALYRLWDKDPTDKYGSEGVAGNFLEYASRGIGKANNDLEVKAIRQALQQTKEELEKSYSAMKELKRQLPDEDDRAEVLRPLSFDDYDADSLAERAEKAVTKIEDLQRYSDSDLLNYGVSSIGYLRQDLEGYGESIGRNFLRYEQDALDEADWYVDQGTFPNAKDVVETALSGMRAFQQAANTLTSLEAKLEEFKKEANHLYQLAEMGRNRGTYGRIFGDYIHKNRERFKGLRSFAQHLRKAVLSSKDISPYKRERLEAVPDKVWMSYVKNGFGEIGRVFKDEGEWLVKDRKLKVPKGSLLYVSDPMPPKIRRKYERGTLTEAEKDFVHKYEIDAAEKVDRLIKEYGFDRYYKVKRISDQKMSQAKSKFWTRRDEQQKAKASVSAAISALDDACSTLVEAAEVLAKIQHPARRVPGTLKIAQQRLKPMAKLVDAVRKAKWSDEDNKEEFYRYYSGIDEYELDALHEMLADTNERGTFPYVIDRMMDTVRADYLSGAEKVKYLLSTLEHDVFNEYPGILAKIQRRVEDMDTGEDVDGFFEYNPEPQAERAVKAFRAAFPRFVKEMTTRFETLQKGLRETERMMENSFGGDESRRPASEDVELLYHASVDARNLKRKGFEKEVPAMGGIGGSQGDKKGHAAVSFTSDLGTAKDIARSLKEAAMLMQGKTKLASLIEEIKQEGILDDVVKSAWHNEDASFPPKTDKDLFALYSTFLALSRKKFNPVFFGGAGHFAKLFKKVKLGDIGVVAAEVDMTDPDINYLTSMHEYRVPPRAIGEVKKLIR